MTVAVKGMEMPTACYLCKLKEWDGDELWCSATEYRVKDFKKIQDFCPLVELPEHHGDLKDADDIKEIHQARVKETNESKFAVYIDDEFDEIVDSAETILEAE